MMPIQEHEISTGARPAGVPDAAPETAAANVQQMFDAIAGRYDLLNHVLSAGIDRWWWWRAARTFRQTLAKPEARVLDLCCGTGDMTLALYRRRHSTERTEALLAVDFSHGMLKRGADKFSAMNILPIECDALHLPIASASLDLISSAFGFRNLASYEAGLAELFRVLKPRRPDRHPRVQPARWPHRHPLQPLLQENPPPHRRHSSLTPKPTRTFPPPSSVFPDPRACWT